MDYLKFLVEKIHTVVAATVDENGLPVTCAMDLMLCDENGIYFLTAKGKGFYNRLVKQKNIALTGIKGESTMKSAAISLHGKVKELGSEPLKEIFEKNPYMRLIYPTEKSARALSVFLIYDGSGEWFDLSKKPIERCSFSFGNEKESGEKYYITDSCNGCAKCLSVCPQSCIEKGSPFSIESAHCLHCGNCLEVCPQGAVKRRNA